MKRSVLAALTHPAVLPMVYPFTRGAAPILMLHRFADHATGNPGHSPEALRKNLAFLRRHRFHVAALPELLASLEHGAPTLYKTVAFTVDDGYADFARVGCDVFAEFDCPVTMFAVTGFLDGHCWLWWDEVDFVLSGTRRNAAEVHLGPAALPYQLTGPAERESARADLVERLKRVDDDVRRAAITRLATDLDVEVPSSPPARYAPMTWEDARACAKRGVTFGPHTVTHPILARQGAEASAAEMTDSWRRLREEVPTSVPVFCYPNGDPDSFTAREQRVLSELGMAAAVSTVHGYASARVLAGGAGRYAVPRFPCLESESEFRQVVGGLERVKRATLGLLGR